MNAMISHNRSSFRFFATLLCGLLMAASAHATDFGDISVKVEMISGGNSNNTKTGYDEYRVTIINRSPTKSHQVTVELRGGEPNEVRRAVEVAPSSTVMVPLFAERAAYVGAVSALIDGTRQRDPVEIDLSRTNAWINTNRNAYYLLVSRDVEKSGLMNDAVVVEGLKAADGEKEVAYLAYPSPMQEWSANWPGYSGFDGVVITAEELREAPDGVRSALWRYVECGGAMVVIGGLDIPAYWRPQPYLHISIKGQEGSGDADKRNPEPPRYSQNYLAGFGRVTVIDTANVKLLAPAQWQAIKLGWKDSRPQQKEYYDIADINRDFPVVERIGIPVRGLFALMLAFVVVIGPINLIWLARRRKKIWMLWTVPAIALVTCLAVTGFALFGEGMSATSRTEAFTILDESSHRATTIGWTAFYSPVTRSDGLHFSYDTELIQQDTSARYSYKSGGFGVVDLSNDQHLSSGWITARVPVYFKFRKSETRRERLTIRQAGNDSISVVNGLGADIQKLWVADRGGKIYAAADIKAGAQATFGFFNLQANGGGGSLRAILSDDDWLAKMKLVEQNVAQYLTPGTYLAVLDASPFVEEGLKDVKTRKAHSLVYGISAEAER